jgi:putative membrane protein
MPGGERTFFQASARERVTAAIKEIEAQTSAEVVVAVRNVSGNYRDVDYLFGFGASLTALAILLFHPYPFATEGMPLDVVAAFALGAFLCAHVRTLRRLFVSRKRREANCLVAARATFVELGVGLTSGRNGILVLVSLFERRVKVVADVGIGLALGKVEERDVAARARADDWRTRVAALEGSLAEGAEIERFLEALRAVAPPLASAMPHQDDDVNELPDEVA